MMTVNDTPVISVIICTYNTKEMTLGCLDKLKKSIDYLGKSVEVIVIENGSDGTGAQVKKKYPWVKLLEPRENTGFAKGNNLGIKAANKKVKYFLLLNTDAFVKRETLKKAVDFMESHSDCDVLGCRLNFGNGKLQGSGGYLPTPFSVLTWIWGLDLIPFVNRFLKSVHPKNVNFFKKERKVGWVMGAFLFMKREVVEKTNGFDENFFMYMEEVEWCKRIKDLEFNIWYTPTFEITHLDKASSKKYPEKLRKIYRNEILGVIYFMRKYYPAQIKWLLPAIKIGLFTRIFTFTLTGNKMRQEAYLETVRDI